MAGEIQLNSTTMATESSGAITLSNVDSATNRTNLGLGSMATQNANAVALTGGSLTGTEIDLKSSGTTIYKSDGTTAVLSESGGSVTAANLTLGTSVDGFGLIRNVELWRLTAELSGYGQDITTANIERDDTYGSGSVLVGSGMSYSSGIFTFPTTGIWLITAKAAIASGTVATYVGMAIKVTTDNSTYNTAATSYGSAYSASEARQSVVLHKIFDVTNVSTHKVKFSLEAGTSQKLQGSTTANLTTFMFMRVGD